MGIEAAMQTFRSRFPEHGAFPLLRGEPIRRVVTRHQVPNKPAAYVVSAVTDHAEIVYMGKAGTLASGRKWKDQMLPGRLCNRQGKVSRQVFWLSIIAETGATQLTFEWFVTVTDKTTLPILVESQLLQAFLDEHDRLPRYNRCA